MFGYFRRERELRRLREQIPMMQGQLAALVMLVGIVINRADKAQREIIMAALKKMVGEHLGVEAAWLNNDADRQVYRDALSGTVQSIIVESSKF